MLGQYSKIAKGNVNITQNIKSANISIPLNLNFKPNIVFLEITLDIEKHSNDRFFISNLMGKECFNPVQGTHYFVWLEVKLTENGCILAVTEGEVYFEIKITNWVAIG